MNRSLTLKLFFMVAFLIPLFSCGGGIGGQVEGDSYQTEGWIDDDTYRLAAAGVPNKSLSNKVQRRESSKRAAILNAQYQVLEKFKGSKIEGASGVSDFESSGMAIAQEVKGVVKGGSVVKATFDEEDNCEVIYEVYARGLKNKVSAAEWE